MALLRVPVGSVVTVSDKPPAGIGTDARSLWASIADAYELDEHEGALLVEPVRTVDLLARLDAEVRRDGPMVDSPQGLKAHPAATEARQQRITLARLLAALRLPSGEEGDEQASARPKRPQRRSGARGTYGIRGVAG